MVVADVPVALAFPLLALPLLFTTFAAVVLALAVVFPPVPEAPLLAPPAASTEPVAADAELLPAWPVPLALPVAAAAVPELLTFVLLLTLTTAALLDPAPIEPPVAIPPPPLLATVTLEVVPFALALPLEPWPLLEVPLAAEVELLAEVPEPLGPAPPALLVEGDVAVLPLLPV